MAASKKVIFEMYWSVVTVDSTAPGGDIVLPVINIRVKRSSDITFDNQQGYTSREDAMRTIRGHVEQIANVTLEELVTRGRIKITGPGKKPS